MKCENYLLALLAILNKFSTKTTKIMPQGRVLDPDSQQGSLTWGYIQRFDGNTWPGTDEMHWTLNRRRVIPFLNENGFQQNDEVIFDVGLRELDGANLGIAINVRLVK